MKWSVISESGIKMELDTEGVSGVSLIIAGEEYEISITKK